MAFPQRTIGLSLILLTSFQAMAQISCPLTNSNLTDLRAAATKLSGTVTLSANCQSYQDNINKATAELNTIATQISTMGEIDPLAATVAPVATTDAETLARQQLASKAIENLTTLNNVFKSEKCGEEAAGILDYADGFTDVVTGVSPFLALYGGAAAAPWVLGTSLGGAAAKMVVGFFKGKDIDMRKADQSASFIKNSCSFYAFNQVKTSLDDLRLKQMPMLQVQLNAAKESVESLEKQAPAEPGLAVFRDQQASSKDKERILSIQARLASDPFEACAYIGRFAREEDARGNKAMVARVWDLYIDTVKTSSTDLAWERDYFMSQLNAPLMTVPADRAQCLDLATRWVNKMISVTDAGQAAAKKIITETDEMKPYLAWLERKSTQATLVASLEAKLKFFNLVTSTGFNIEYSEIIRGHQQVQDSLFRSYKFLSLIRMRGLAEAWLKVKYEDSVQGLKDFRERKSHIDKRLDSIQKLLGKGVEMNLANIQAFAARHKETRQKDHPEIHSTMTVDLCNQLRKAWSSWYGGLIHAEAGRDYCDAFDNVIDKMDYPQVQQLCFGFSSRKRSARSGSLRNLVDDMKSYRPQGEVLLGHMKALSCRQAPETTADLLKTKLE